MASPILDTASWEWDNLIIILLVAIFSVSWLASSIVKKSGKKDLPLPPGPRGLPFVGNLPFVHPTFDYFAKLTQTYGPIFKLQLGQKMLVMINSPALAKEVVKDQDSAFYRRDPRIATLILTYGGVEMGAGPRNDVWRDMRKFCISEMMSDANLKSLDAICREEVGDLVRDLYAKAGSSPINLSEMIFLTVQNITMCTLWGATLRGEEKYTLGLEIKHLIEESIWMFEEPNISDTFPMLAPFDLQGVEAKAKKLHASFDKVFESFMGGRMSGLEKNEGKVKKDDFLHVLLEFRKQHKSSLTNTQIKGMYVDLLLASADTSSLVSEWAMAELLHHPEVMRKACKELEQVVLVGSNNNSRNNVVVEESHLAKLPYLNAIIKEAMRLHPGVPMLIRRSPGLNLGGYSIPKGARILVNSYALHRNPKVWKNPSEFKPERFLSPEEKDRGSYFGTDLNYLPFGSGRRLCTGISLVEKMVPYVLANLLLHFDWTLPEGAEIDFEHRLGVALRKAKPIVVVPTPKLSS